jgi:hypothetical protein
MKRFIKLGTSMIASQFESVSTRLRRLPNFLLRSVPVNGRRRNPVR